MKTLGILKFSFIKTIRNRKNIFYILVLSLSTLLILSSLAISSYIKDFIDKSINSNVGFRTINVNPNYNYDDYGLKVLEDNKHILENYSSKYSGVTLESSFKNERQNGKIGLLYGSKYTQPIVVKGNNIKDDDSGVAICPMTFYPDDNINDLKIDQALLISSDELYNKEFTVKYNTSKYNGYSFEVDKEFTKKFKVVGLYDNTQSLNMNNECYISPKDIKDIMETIYYNLNEDTIYSTFSIVDEIQNVDKVMSELRLNGFEDLTQKTSIDYGFVDKILNSLEIILIFVCSFVCIISFLFVKKKMHNELYEIGLMKTIGYRKSKIVTIYLFETFISCFVSLFIGILIFQIIYIIITNNIFIAFKYIGIDLVNKPIFYIITILLITIIPFICNLEMILKIYKKDSALLMGSDET